MFKTFEKYRKFELQASVIISLENCKCTIKTIKRSYFSFIVSKTKIKKALLFKLLSHCYLDKTPDMLNLFINI
jgi:hypothetical protein